MNRRGWVFTLVYIVTAVSLLLTGASAIAAEPTEQKKPPKQTELFEQCTDANKNRIFDNLEKRMVSAGTEQPFGIIIQFTQPLSEIDFPFLKHDIGPFSTRYEYPSINAISTTLTKGQIIAASKHGLVKQIEFNGEVHASLDTSTDWFGVKKARTDFGVDGNTDGSATYSDKDIVIAVIDTGIYATHVDLDGGKVIGWRDFVDNQSTPYDDNGHGTHVASIAAGTGEGSRTYTGVAPGAALVGVKVLDGSGSGTWDDVIAGIQWVISNKKTLGIEVMNLSLGASGSSDGTSSIEQLVNEAVDAGIVAVVAAGNDGPWSYTVGVPAAAEKAITVGAMADVGKGGFFLADFSSRGPTLDGRTKPDISSPGYNIMAAKSGSTSGYTTKSGTSMATPFAAGVAALMLDANSNLSPDAVKTMMMETAVDWGQSGKDIDYGAGRLDAYQAIQTAGSFTGTGPIMPNHDYKADSLGGQNSSDWWDVNVTNITYPIGITMIMPGWSSYTSPDFDMRLYAPNGTQVGSSWGATRQETISYQPTVTGTYRLMVFVYKGNGPYFFDVSAGTTLLPPDTMPPAAVVNLAAGSPTSGSITLTWTAPGDDGSSGTASQYDIRYSTSAINESNWALVTQATGEPTPLLAGTAQSFVVTGLNPNTTYYFALKTADEVPNWSGISNSPSAKTLLLPDTTPPAAVVNLGAGSPTSGSITLTWTAPGDDGSTGTAFQYDIRYSKSPINEANWTSAIQASGEPTPLPARSAQSFVVTGLNRNTTYYFALKTADEVHNWSGISNSPSAKTSPKPPRRG